MLRRIAPPQTTAQPIGSVTAYAGPVAFDQPDSTRYPAAQLTAYRLNLARQGWLLCDGSSVAIARYPLLFRAIGYIYGQGSDAQGQMQPGFFHLPDYRGRVLRGVNGDASDPLGTGGEEQARDPDASLRLAQAPSGWSGNAVGSVQYDALQTHVHSYQMAGSTPQVSQQGGQGSSQNSPQDTAPATNLTNDPALRASQETRAKNQYVHFLIRAF